MPLALITGPTAGIGLAFAHALAAEGHDLVLVSRDERMLRTVADEVSRRHEVACQVLGADLADIEATRRVEQRLRDVPVDVLVNNAGFGMALSFEDNDLEEEQRGLDVMVRAPLRLTHAALATMRARGRGEIVNVASVAGFLPRGTYGAHKAWLINFSRWANIHYAPQGVRVMALCPGFVRTEFHQRMKVDMSSVPACMWLDANDLVRAALSDLRAGRPVSIPSWRYKALISAARVTPDKLVEKLARAGR